MDEYQWHEESEHPFYGDDILRKREQDYINTLLAKYKNLPPNEELKQKIWDELQMEKYHGRIKIPFKVVLRHDTYREYPDYVEVILDTKV